MAQNKGKLNAELKEFGTAIAALRRSLANKSTIQSRQCVVHVLPCSSVQTDSITSIMSATLFCVGRNMGSVCSPCNTSSHLTLRKEIREFHNSPIHEEYYNSSTSSKLTTGEEPKKLMDTIKELASMLKDVKNENKRIEDDIYSLGRVDVQHFVK